MPRSTKPTRTQVIQDLSLSMISLVSLSFLITLTTTFYRSSVAGDPDAKKIASMMAFAAFAQGCEVVDRVLKLGALVLGNSHSDKGDRCGREEVSSIVHCLCLKARHGDCFGDTHDEVCDLDDNGVISWSKRRCELPLREVSRGYGEYRVQKARVNSMTALIEDSDATPKASEVDDDVADDVDRVLPRPGRVFVDEVDEGRFVWDDEV